MPYAFRSNTGMSVITASPTYNATLPVGWQPGDLLLFFTGTSSTGQTITTPAGYQLISPDNNTTYVKLYARFAQAGDTAPIGSWSGGNAFGDMAAFSGSVFLDMTQIVNVSADKNSSSVNLVSFNNGTLTPTVANCLVIAGGSRQTFQAGTYGGVNIGGFTKISEATSSSQGISGVWDYQIQTTATAMANAAQTKSVNDTFSTTEGGFLIALKPVTPPTLPLTSFNPAELPVFIQAPRRSLALYAVDSIPLEILSLPIAPPPPGNYDFPPPASRPFPAYLRASELNLVESALYQQDSVLLPTEWDYSWEGPLDRMPVALRAESSPLTVLELLALTTYAPYIEYNWPVPPSARRAQQLLTGSFPLELIGKDVVYGAPGQGPQNNMWDPPRARPFPIENRTFVSSGLALTATPPQKPPPNLSDQPVPRAPRRFFNDFIQGTPETLLRFLTTYPPFAGSTDLPPRGRLQPGDRGYAYSVLALLFNQGQLPPISLESQSSPPRSARFPLSALEISYSNPFLIPVTPPIGGAGVRHMGRLVLDPVFVGEEVIVPFDFISGLATGEVIVQAQTTATLYSGTDPNPQVIIQGPAIPSGTIANQLILPLILGNIYVLACTAITSLSEVLILTGLLAVEPLVP